MYLLVRHCDTVLNRNKELFSALFRAIFGRCGARLSLFYLTHYTADFSCVSPLPLLRIISCPPPFHFSGWVGGGDIMNQVKSSSLEALTSTGELMEICSDLSHFLRPRVAAALHLSYTVGRRSTLRS